MTSKVARSATRQSRAPGGFPARPVPGEKPATPIARVENQMAPVLSHPGCYFAGTHGNWGGARAELEFTDKPVRMLESLYESPLTRA